MKTKTINDMDYEHLLCGGIPIPHNLDDWSWENLKLLDQIVGLIKKRPLSIRNEALLTRHLLEYQEMSELFDILWFNEHGLEMQEVTQSEKV